MRLKNIRQVYFRTKAKCSSPLDSLPKQDVILHHELTCSVYKATQNTHHEELTSSLTLRHSIELGRNTANRQLHARFCRGNSAQPHTVIYKRYGFSPKKTSSPLSASSPNRSRDGKTWSPIATWLAGIRRRPSLYGGKTDCGGGRRDRQTGRAV